MKTFLIRFYYGNDLRAEEKITSMNETNALAKALDNIQETWVTHKVFRIEIHLA